MSNYTKSTNFASKDALASGNPLKIVKGTEIDTEFNNIAIAISTKTDNASAVITGGSIDNVVIGGSTAAAGSFTNLSASGTVSGSGFSTYLASPPAIGGTTAAAGSFTNLSSSGTVSGTGFSNYLASPPAIGGTTANTGAFTTLSASGNVTLSGGTANGVGYLNGSKQFTTGSALTFDGSNLGVTGYIQSANYLGATGGGNASYYFSTATGSTFNNSGVPYLWQIGGTEYMRLTSTGLGIGTSSPGAKLDVSGTMRATGATSLAWDGGQYTQTLTTSSFIPYLTQYSWTGGGSNYYATRISNQTSAIVFETGTSAVPGSNTFTERMRLDSSGNLGLGVTPSAWGAGRKAIQISNPAQVVSSGLVMEVGSNWYNDGTNYRYTVSNTASLYSPSNGAHAWFTAPSGTAGNAISFTQAMTLDANGNLGVGTTSPLARFHSLGTSTTAYDGSGAGSDLGAQLTTGTAIIGNTDTTVGSYAQLVFQPSQGSGPAYARIAAIKTAAASSAIAFSTRDGSTVIERARIDSSGNFLINTSDSGALPGDGYVFIKTASTQYIGHASGTASGTGYLQFWYNGASIGSVTQSGTTAVLFNVTSDQRLKENIVDAPEFGSVIDSIKVRSYDWKADGNHQRAGFVAQELVTVAPEAVHQPADPEEMMAVDYSKLVPMLVKEIQSLRKRLAAAGIA